MGNLCGKETTPDPHAENARPLAPDAALRANQSSSVPRKVGGPPRTLGSGAPTPLSQEDARIRAAEAAEARAKAASTPKGKLGTQLQEQKKQSRVDTLSAASRDERRTRDTDATAQTMAYN